MSKTTANRILLLISLTFTGQCVAFCGFYVARADAELYNQASQVVLVRDQNKTVITMKNDFRGDTNEFALIVPVPTMIEREQINVADPALLDRLDAYTAPRLVEYFDADPCRTLYRLEAPMANAVSEMSAKSSTPRARSLGVTVEARYAVGEYDILILSATQSAGLMRWLDENNYEIPTDAGKVIAGYLKQGMRFFVARVNLETQAKLGYSFLRPLQIAYDSPRFMLPIRLGMVNANGPQDLYVYTLTRTGRVETRNYPTARIPSGETLPVSVQAKFADFYRAMFTRTHEQHRARASILEYAWDMAWCDPCAADPLSAQELRALGVFWLDANAATNQGVNTFVTRLHIRYDQQHFPEDLMFIETGDRENFQGRYVIRHPWTGASRCPAATKYFTVTLPQQRRAAAIQLANLTGWPAPTANISTGEARAPWWRFLWKNSRSTP